jgi:streptogramin lyase
MGFSRWILATFVAIGVGFSMSHAADQTILGDTLQVKNPSTADKRKVVGKAKEMGSDNTLVGDPTVAGATLTVRANGGTPSSQTFSLPAGTSASTGKPFWSGDAAKGFKYKDAKSEIGPIKGVVIRRSGKGVFQITASGGSKVAAITVLPPDLGTDGCLLLEIAGGDTYSVQFAPNDGVVSNKGSREYKHKKPSGEGTCVTTTTTTTTSSTSTTSTTLCGAFIKSWGGLGTAAGKFDEPFGVAVDADGDVFVTDANNHRVQKFDNDGNFIKSWDATGMILGKFSYPGGIAVGANGNVTVLDNEGYVRRFDNDGTTLLRYWGGFAVVDLGVFLAVDGDGNTFVTEVAWQDVEKFDINGFSALKWGSSGSANGQFSIPWGIAVDAIGNVLVADNGNNRVQIFNNVGLYLTKFGTGGSGPGEFAGPAGIAVDGTGNIFVGDYGNNRIQRFDANGTFIDTWGSGGTGDGQFNSPNGIATDANGHVFVVDRYNHRVQKFGCQ